MALIGELDGLVVAGHPERDPMTGAAHACGHNAQVAAMLGAAMGLLDADAFAHLAGRVVFFAVPAEEGATSSGESPRSARGGWSS